MKTYPIKSSEITPKHVYLSRRAFIKAAGVIAGSAALAACGPQSAGTPQSNATQPAAAGKTDELGNPLNSFQDITHYNNYYEFSTDKEGVARLVGDFKTSPW